MFGSMDELDVLTARYDRGELRSVSRGLQQGMSLRNAKRSLGVTQGSVFASLQIGEDFTHDVIFSGARSRRPPSC